MLCQTVVGIQFVLWWHCSVCEKHRWYIVSTENQHYICSEIKENAIDMYKMLQQLYEGVSKSFQMESVTKYLLTFGNTGW